jgi:hypothetical protein
MDTYTVYGRVKTGLTRWGEVEFKALSLERAPSLEMANSFVEDAIATYKEPCVECVIVELRGDRDSYGSRRVVRRLNDAKAWWE